MATLTNTQINQTYIGLLKFDDNGTVQPTTLKALSDGTGGSLPISLSQVETKFTPGTIVDLTGVTVNGLSAGGLVQGTGTDAMQSAAFLTTTAANASGQFAIALGENARAEATQAIAIGRDAECLTSDSIVIGNSCSSSSGPSVTIGRGASANGSVATAIGNSANVSSDQSIGISGENITISGSRSVGLGRQVTITTGNSIGIGNFAKVTGNRSFSFTSCGIATNEQKANEALMMVPGGYGCTTNVLAANSIVLGSATSQLERASNPGSISIGLNTQSTADNAVALGAGVVANRANTTSVTELEVQSNGGGVVLFSPNGTGYKVTVTDGGLLQTTAI